MLLHSLVGIFTWHILDSQECKFFHADNEDSDQTVHMSGYVGCIQSSLGAHALRYILSHFIETFLSSNRKYGIIEHREGET